MLTARIDRLWMIGGAMVATVLLALSWLLLISPRLDEAAALNEEVAGEQVKIATLQSKLAQMTAQNQDIVQYRAQLQRNRAALPPVSAMADFLRELQRAGDATGVAATALTVGGATPVTAAGATFHALPVAVTVTGGAGELSRFLHDLQQVRPRAVLINSANMSPIGEQGSLNGTVSLSISLQVFVAPTTK